MFRLTLLWALAAAMTASATTVQLPPAPGDLSQVAGLTESRTMHLRVNGQDAFVYHAAKTGASDLSARGVDYCIFSFADGPANLELACPRQVRAWRVQSAAALTWEAHGDGLSLTLSSPAKVLITAELSDGTALPCVVSAEAPETTPAHPGERGVLYLGPGVHRFGRAWNPFVGDIHTVYLAPGAVVEATLKVRGGSQLRLCGRGLLMQAAFPHAAKVVDGNGWYADYMGMYFRDCTDLTIDGIASLCAPSFQLEVANCEHVKICNVKLLGFGEKNNDGMHLYSRDVTVDDCFVAGNDDRICLNGLYDADLPPAVASRLSKQERLTSSPVENLTIRHVTFWGLSNGADIMLTWNAGADTRHVLVEDCLSLTATNKAFVAARHAGSGTLDDIRVHNCRLEHGRLVDLEVADSGKYWGKGGGSIGRIEFDRIALAVDAKAIGQSIAGRDARGQVGPVVFRDLTARGTKVSSLADTHIRIGAHVVAATLLPSSP